MHFPSIVTALALSLPLLSSVAAGSSDVAKRGGHKQHIKRNDKLVKRDYSGIATFYNGETGQQGACGVWVNNNGWTVAIAGHLYGDYGQKSYWCGKQLVITGNGKTATATVVDACPGCGGAAGLDMTPGLFAYFISPDAGVMDITWHLAGDDAPAPEKPSPTPAYTPPTTYYTPPPPSSTWTPPSSTWQPPPTTSWTPEWTPSSSSWTPEWTPSSSSSSSQWTPSSSSSRYSSSSSRASSSSSRSSSSSSWTSPSAAASSTALINGTNTNSTLRGASNANSTGLTNSTLLPNSTDVAVGRNSTTSSSSGGASTNLTDASIASGNNNKNADGTTGNLGRTAQIILDIAGLAYAAAEQN